MAREVNKTFSIDVTFYTMDGMEIDELTAATEGNPYPFLKTEIKKAIKEACSASKGALSCKAASEVTES